ncbi:hypothetical protein [Nostoc sp.]|uniref:hypothetical protein n=1 Tax=Nostoc sp. TaxID=1180 RepID=UPI002FFBFF92
MPADNLEINETIAAPFAQLVLDCIGRQYLAMLMRPPAMPMHPDAMLMRLPAMPMHPL